MPEFEVISPPEGIQLQLRSPTGEVLAYLSDTDKSGAILNAQIVERKIGGVEKFSFQISSDNDLPITRNTECFFYVSGVLRFIGQVVEIPLPDQDDPVLEIRGEGFYKNLYKKVINENYSSANLEDIINDICSNYLGADIDIFYNSFKIDVPNLTNITVEFKDKNLFQVFSTILQIANYDYDNAKYRFYVDNEKDFVFELLPEELRTGLFEGYQYQTPEVTEDNSNIINKILTFRTTVADPKAVEYVNTYEDTESQGRFGLFEKKITFPDYIDTPTIANICDFILERRSLPQTKIAVTKSEVFRKDRVSADLGTMNNGAGEEPWNLDFDLSTTEQITLATSIRRGLSAVDFGNWAISNKRNLFWEIIAECDSLNNWDLSNLSVTTAVLSATRVLTGRQSIKFTTGSGSDGEYAEFVLDQEIPLAQLARLYIYFEDTVDKISIIFSDTFGNTITLEFGSVEGTLEVDTSTPATDDAEIDYSLGTDLLDVDIINAVTFNQWLKLIQNIDLQTTLSGFEVKPNGGLFDFQVAAGIDFTDLMDRGNCESTDPPMIQGETTPLNVGVSWARSADQAAEGSFSYKLTKTDGTAGNKYISIFDNESTTDLHGLLPGKSYNIKLKYYIPSTGGPSLTGEFRLLVQNYVSGAWSGLVSATGTNPKDAWNQWDFDFTIDAAATGIRIWFYLVSLTQVGEFVYIDNIEMLQPVAEDFEVRVITNPGLLNVKTIRINMLTNNVLNFYLDRIDAYANIYKYHELQLEEVIFNLASKLFTAELNFGELEDNIIDEIDKKVEEGDTALAIFSKQ